MDGGSAWCDFADAIRSDELEPMVVCTSDGDEERDDIVASALSSLHLYTQVPCPCGTTTRCTARADEMAHVLHLDVETCTDPRVDCSCNESRHVPVASCSFRLPEGGEWTVRVDGTDLFTMNVPGEAPAEPRTRCWTPAGPTPGHVDSCPPLGSPAESEHDVTVSPTQAPRAGHIGSLAVNYGCAGCLDAPGPCQVSVSGDTIVARPQVRECSCPSCGQCLDACVAMESQCRLPPLPEGSYVVGDDRLEVTSEPADSPDNGVVGRSPYRILQFERSAK